MIQVKFLEQKGTGLWNDTTLLWNNSLSWNTEVGNYRYHDKLRQIFTVQISKCRLQKDRTINLQNSGVVVIKTLLERSDESPPQGGGNFFGPAHCCRWVLVHFWWTEIDFISVIFKSTFYFFRQRGTNMRLIVCFYQKNHYLSHATTTDVYA